MACQQAKSRNQDRVLNPLFRSYTLRLYKYTEAMPYPRDT